MREIDKRDLEVLVQKQVIDKRRRTERYVVNLGWEFNSKGKHFERIEDAAHYCARWPTATPLLHVEAEEREGFYSVYRTYFTGNLDSN